MPSVSKSAKKVAHHRKQLRASGLRPVQFWVPDTRSTAFVARVRKQCKDLQGDPTEAEILDFTEDAARQIEGWQ